jgi:hypothetical protein
MSDWDIYLVSEVLSWLEDLQATDIKTADLVDDAIYALSRSGPCARSAAGGHHHRLGDQELKGAAPRVQRRH